MAKILVVDDEVYIRELLRKTFVAKGYEVVTVPSAQQALELIFNQPHDLVLLDVELAGESGLSVLKEIREHQKKLPVVIYSGIVTPEFETEAMRAGADEVMNKSVGIEVLTERIGKVLKARERILEDPSSKKEKSVLVVDDEAGIRNVLKSFFQTKGYTISEAECGEKALELARAQKFSAVLLDINMPGIGGIETLKKLLEIDPKLGVVMVTSEQDDENVNKAVSLGAYGYVLKPFDFLYLELVVTSRLAIAEG